MRVWLSVPIVKGIRTGVSVNPNSFVTRKLSWNECLSDKGKTVRSAGAVVIACCMALWVYADANALLVALIMWLIATWIWNRITLGLYPRQFSENPIGPAELPKCQPW